MDAGTDTSGEWVAGADGGWVWRTAEGTLWRQDDEGRWVAYTGAVLQPPPNPTAGNASVPSDSDGEPFQETRAVPGGPAATGVPLTDIVPAGRAAHAPAHRGGLLSGMKERAEAARAKREQAHRAAQTQRAEGEHQAALSQWQEKMDTCHELRQRARSFEGSEDGGGLVLKKAERAFYAISNCSLVEDRRGAGHYVGRSQGFSIPVAKIGGRSVRYRVGASKGTFVQGTPVPTAIDHGTVHLTNQRVVFMGSKQTRECLFTKLVGYDSADGASTTFSVSNRQKPTVIHYGADLHFIFTFNLELALAHFRDSVDEYVATIDSVIAELEGQRP